MLLLQSSEINQIYCEEWELDRLEIACIKMFHSHVSEGGYNITWGGNAPMMGRKHTEEWKKEASARMSGEKNWNYGKFGKENPLYGRKRTEEEKTKMREGIAKNNNPNRKRFGKENPFFGKHHSKETIKLLAVNFGKKLKGATSKYYGVSIHNVYANNKHYVYWRCYVGTKILGQYKTEIEAALAYDKYVIENKIDRPLNFPKEDEQRQ